MIAARKLFFAFLISSFLLIELIFVPKKTLAENICTASTSHSSVNISSITDFSFTINNTGGETITYIRVDRPSSNFTLTNIGIPNWTENVQGDFAELTGGSIASGASFQFNLRVTTGSSEASSANWQIVTNSGSGNVACPGSLGTAIAGVADFTPPELSDITVSDVANTSTKISWSTNENANSYVGYDTSNSYSSEQNVSDGTLATSHSLTLTGLTSNTTYYYYVQSTDANGNTRFSDDSTFTTAKASSTTSTTTTTTTTTKATPTPTPKPTDKTAPNVLIDFDFSKPFKEAPKITGKATDTGLVDPGIAKIEYSTDDGKNWIPVDEIQNSKGKSQNSVTFEFTPALFEDGNYKIKARATDLAGNKGVSKSYALIIDRLPPMPGGSFISIGPQGLLPDDNGTIHTTTGVSQKITLSAVGGPTEIQIKSQNSKVFEMVKNPDNGLWSGDLLFESPGKYTLIANSKDGAGNVTKRELSIFNVLSPGRIKSRESAVKDAKLSVYYLDPTSNDFVLWDAGSYGQNNPQITSESGEYQLYLPPGSYYIEVEASNYKTFRSDIFTLDKSLPITSNISLEEVQKIKILFFTISVPDFTVTRGRIDITGFEATPVRQAQGKPSKDNVQLPITNDQSIGKTIPEAELREEDKIVNTSGFRGKPFVLTFLNTWVPGASGQIGILEKLALSNDAEVVVIMPQESASKVGIYKKRGGYSLPIYADPDGILVESLNLQSLPTHIFLDRTGKIVGVKTGILSETEIMDSFR